MVPGQQPLAEALRSLWLLSRPVRHFGALEMGCAQQPQRAGWLHSIPSFGLAACALTKEGPLGSLQQRTAECGDQSIDVEQARAFAVGPVIPGFDIDPDHANSRVDAGATEPAWAGPLPEPAICVLCTVPAAPTAASSVQLRRGELRSTERRPPHR